jgi:hypothetical protein
MRDTYRRGRYVDLGSELQIVPNGGSKPLSRSEDLLLDELLDVHHLVRARARGLPPALNIPDIIASELHGHFPSYCHA